jgi:hypothetical protein
MSSGFDALGNPTGGAAATPYKPVDKKAAAGAASAAKKAASEAEKAAKDAAVAIKKAKDELAGVMADLFPDQGKMDKLLDQGRKLDAALAAKMISPDEWQKARDRLRDEIAVLSKETQDAGRGILNIPGIGTSLPLNADDSIDQIRKSIVDKFEEAKDKASESMANLANNVLNSLSGLANSIKSGGFLDIISAAFNAFGSVAKTGILGKGLGTSFKDFTSISGFRANGGSVTGGSTYVVGERGPELFTATQSGYIHPNGANDNGGRGMQVQVVKGDLFDVIVTGISDSRVSAAAPSIVSGASRGTQTAMQRRASRRLA